MQQLTWSSAAAEVALTLAALNTRALARAGMVDDGDANAMHHLLDTLDGAAGTADQEAICRMVRQLLPLAPEPS